MCVKLLFLRKLIAERLSSTTSPFCDEFSNLHLPKSHAKVDADLLLLRRHGKQVLKNLSSHAPLLELSLIGVCSELQIALLTSCCLQATSNTKSENPYSIPSQIT